MTRVERRRVRRRADRRTRMTLAIIGVVIGVTFAGAGVAVAYWLSTDSSNPAAAEAGTLPTGSTPGPPVTTPNSNSSTVAITFTQATTSAGVAIPASDYVLRRYPVPSGSDVVVTATCSGTGTMTCTELGVPDGTWRYTDTPDYGTNWTGTESAKSGSVIVDTTPPTVGGTIVGQSSGASTNDYIRKNTGYYVYANVTDAGSGVASVTANVNGMTTGSTAVALTSSGGPFTAPAGGSYAYRSALLTSNATQADGPVSYTVNAHDNAGNVSSYVDNGSATFDSTAPSSTLSVSGHSGGGVYLSGATVYYQGSSAGSFTLTNALTDAGSGPASSGFPALTGTSTGFAHGAATISTPTGGPYVSTTFSWTAGTTTGPTEVVTGTDNVGNTVTTTLTFVDDTGGPVNKLTLANQSGGPSVISGTTVYYQGSTAGSFTLTNALTDAGSGPASSGFPALTGTSTGFSHSAATISTPTGGPYVSSTFSWTAGTTTGPTEVVTGTDNVGNTVTTTLTFVDDTATLTQGVPTSTGASGHTKFTGTASSATTVTVYYCTPAATPCTAANKTGSVTVTASAGVWTTGTVTLTHGTTYSSTAYQTDTDGNQLVSNTQTFTP